MRRPSDVSTLTVPVTVMERLILDDLMSKSGLSTDANLTRLAMRHLAKHYEVDLPAVAFRLRHRGGSQRVKGSTKVQRGA